jgi:2-hydroxy-6-oxonona-2,4-dienedioate hydrolase
LVLLHGVSLSAAAWAPLFTALPDRRLLAVDLPGHGLSDPASYRRGHVRQNAHQLIEDTFDALELERAPIVGHSLGATFALWYAATGTGRISSLVAVGEPAVALTIQSQNKSLRTSTPNIGARPSPRGAEWHVRAPPRRRWFPNP